MNGQFGYGYASPEEAAILAMLDGNVAPQVDRDIEVGGYYGVQGWQGQNGEIGYYDVQGAPEAGWYQAVGADPAACPPPMMANPQTQLFAGRGTQPYQSRPSPAMFPTSPQPPGALTVVKRDPQTSRVLFVGFRSAALILPAATANVTSSPNDTIAPRKVVVPPTSAPSFDINDIKVGSTSQFGSGDPVPAETFLPDSMNTDVRFDTAQIAQPITFSVTNIGAADARFRASINGFVVRL